MPAALSAEKEERRSAYLNVCNNIKFVLVQFKSPIILLSLDSYHYLLVIDIAQVVLRIARWLHEEEPFVWK